jgi:hypothetical protein
MSADHDRGKPKAVATRLHFVMFQMEYFLYLHLAGLGLSGEKLTTIKLRYGTSCTLEILYQLFP